MRRGQPASGTTNTLSNSLSCRLLFQLHPDNNVEGGEGKGGGIGGYPIPRFTSGAIPERESKCHQFAQLCRHLHPSRWLAQANLTFERQEKPKLTLLSSD